MAIRRDTSSFRPTHKVEIYDGFEERKRGAPVKIAEVLSDGVQGRIRMLDERFRGLIEGLFSLGSLVMELEPNGSDSLLNATRPRSATHSLAGIRQVVEHELGPHNLYAAVQGLE